MISTFQISFWYFHMVHAVFVSFWYFWHLYDIFSHCSLRQFAMFITVLGLEIISGIMYYINVYTLKTICSCIMHSNHFIKENKLKLYIVWSKKVSVVNYSTKLFSFGIRKIMSMKFEPFDSSAYSTPINISHQISWIMLNHEK